jgi:sigma54-dependent transcription regulator
MLRQGDGGDKALPRQAPCSPDGILFVDEIGELGLDEQAMLLRAIEEKTFLPVGADAEETSDF